MGKKSEYPTMAEKYKETFGVEPKDKFGDFVCPLDVGFHDIDCKKHTFCDTCCRAFWNSEYKKKEV